MPTSLRRAFPFAGGKGPPHPRRTKIKEANKKKRGKIKMYINMCIYIYIYIYAYMYVYELTCVRTKLCLPKVRANLITAQPT
ncbi:hypothetical protein PVIIG_02448 [Plasmodium vivax India VII]|uniref:Uncharacterized protein n=1 Tax=Plasmodium vivax India VII TaxID=1077284 RepID=A0A0J9SL00_PLAVI|nr:hypothetical protein PVIIG_02448 [Plasmodium vivax India VII]